MVLPLFLLLLLLFQPCSLSSSLVLSFLMLATTAATNNIVHNNNNDYERENEDKTTITTVESNNHWGCQDDDDDKQRQDYCHSTPSDDDHSSNNNNNECDTRNFELLGKCQKTCMVCYEGQKFPQRDGRGKIAPKTTIDLWKLQRQINLFYYNNNNKNSIDNNYYNNLPYYPSKCTDISEDCAMYALKGLCSSSSHNEYKDYVWKHCPRMCQICDIQKLHIFIQKILNPIQNSYYYYNTRKEDTTTVMTTTTSRHHRALNVLLSKLNMDPKLLLPGGGGIYYNHSNKRDNNNENFVVNNEANFENDGNNNSNDSTSTNFMYELYEKLHMWIPEPIRKMYDPLSSSHSSNSSSSALATTEYDIDFLEKLFHIEYDEDNMNTNNDDDDTSNNNNRKRRIQNMIENHILISFRSRGYIVGGGDSSIIESLDTLLLRPIQLGIGFAIPNNHALEAIQNLHQPIIEVGAGTGYWSNLLYYQYDVDIVAYDIDPPPFLPSSSTSSTETTTSTIMPDNDDSSDGDNNSCHNSNSQQRQQSTTTERRATTRENAFFDVAYFDKIQKGSCIDVIESYAPDRVLLIIWPNDPDPIDKNDELFFGDGSSSSENEEEEHDDENENENVHHQDQVPSSSSSSYSSSSSQPVWDVDCLNAYILAGGQTVIYIGERGSIIPNLIKLNNNQNNYYDNNDDDLARQQQQQRRRDSGTSSTRKFQQMLEQYMDLVDVINIPSWWLNYDDMTIWRRKKKKEYE